MIVQRNVDRDRRHVNAEQVDGTSNTEKDLVNAVQSPDPEEGWDQQHRPGTHPNQHEYGLVILDNAIHCLEGPKVFEITQRLDAGHDDDCEGEHQPSDQRTKQSR